MKNLIIFFFLLIAIGTRADDTAALQALITAGNTTLPSGHAAYSITQLTLTHSLNVNGNTINCTGTSGAAFIMNTAGVKLSNGILTGLTDVLNTTGPYCVRTNANNDTITNCTISKFPAYGILGGSGNSLVVTNSTISDTGYIGMYYDSSTASTIGGKCTGNTFDRSMLSASTIQQPALAIRAEPGYKSRGWTVSNNIFKMPSNPTDGTAAGFELRRCPLSLVSSNNCQGGIIGVSIVTSDSVKTTGSNCTGQSSEGLEYADSNYGMLSNNIITSQLNRGILIDGSSGCHYDTLAYNTISGCAGTPIHLYLGCSNIFIVACDISVAVANVDAIKLQGANTVGICICNFDGHSTARNVVEFDNSTGTVDMCSGTIKNFTSNVMKVYASTPIVVNNILMQNVNLSGTPTGLGSTLSNGASLGSNIQVN